VSLGGSSAETEHMHKLLKDIETVMAEKRVAIDHRAHGFKTCKNAGASGVGVGCMYIYNGISGSQMTRTRLYLCFTDALLYFREPDDAHTTCCETQHTFRDDDEPS
jgi:hypothetical protein